MSHRRPTLRVVVAGMALFTVVGLSIRAPIASANPRCPNGGFDYHTYSTARYCDGTAANDVYLQTQNDPISTSDANDLLAQGPNGNEDGHIEDEVWVATQNLTWNYYLETGVIRAVNPTTQTAGYWLFWSDTKTVNGVRTSYVHYPFTSQRSPNGAAYTFYLYYSGGYWYIQSSECNCVYAKSTIQDGVYAWSWQVGLEEYDADYDGFNTYNAIDPDESTGGDTFLNYLEVSSNGGGSWHFPNDLDPYGATSPRVAVRDTKTGIA
jgi:hypothetical protein